MLAPPTPNPESVSGATSGPSPGHHATPEPGVTPAAGDHAAVEPRQSTPLLVDTHVHLHDGHDAQEFLNGAAGHFAAAGAGLGVLCLTETFGTHGFQRLAEATSIGPWHVEPVGERALIARHRDGAAVGLIAGRQIRCDDGLEVAAVGRPVDIEDGQPFIQSIDAARDSGALTMLCYGVGKWSGTRGAKVRAVLENGPRDIAFGDNSGRLGRGDQAILKQARTLGRTVLVGSDPLNLRMAKQRAGCWGVVAEVADGRTLDAGWADRVVEALKHLGPTPTTFGARVSGLTAIAQQIGVRLP